MRGSEEKVSWTDRGYAVLHPVLRGPSGYHVEFVTLMRHLRPICGLGGEPDFEIAVTKDFGRTPPDSNRASRKASTLCAAHQRATKALVIVASRK